MNTIVIIIDANGIRLYNTDENDWNFWTDRKCIEYCWLFLLVIRMLLLSPLLPLNTEYVGHSDRNKWMFFFVLFVTNIHSFWSFSSSSSCSSPILSFFRLSFNTRHTIVILDRLDHSKYYCLFCFSHPSRLASIHLFLVRPIAETH